MMFHQGRAIRRHFAEGLDAAASNRLRRHLRRCPRCRADYDQAAELLRAAAGGGPTRREGLALWRAVEVNAFEPPAAETREPSRAPHRRGWGLLLPALAAVLVAGLVAVGLVRQATPPSRAPAGVQYRGGTAPAGALLDLEVFAIRRGAEGPTARRLADGDTLSTDEWIQLRYRNDDPRLAYLYVFGLDRNGTVLDYFPRPSEQRSRAIGSGTRARGVGPSLRLGVRHRSGPLRVYGLFSARPLERQRVHAAVLRARQSSTFPARLELDGSAGVEPRLVIRRFRVESDAAAPR
jgi:hypothetical protein